MRAAHREPTITGMGAGGLPLSLFGPLSQSLTKGRGAQGPRPPTIFGGGTPDGSTHGSGTTYQKRSAGSGSSAQCGQGHPAGTGTGGYGLLPVRPLAPGSPSAAQLPPEDWLVPGHAEPGPTLVTAAAPGSPRGPVSYQHSCGGSPRGISSSGGLWGSNPNSNFGLPGAGGWGGSWSMDCGGGGGSGSWAGLGFGPGPGQLPPTCLGLGPGPTGKEAGRGLGRTDRMVGAGVCGAGGGGEGDPPPVDDPLRAAAHIAGQAVVDAGEGAGAGKKHAC